MSAILKKPTPTIKKGSGSAEHTDQTEHKEVDILFDRFLEYKSITKGLISYYEDLARLETHTANEMVNIGGHLPVPLREGNQFLPEGGWQSILYDTREQTRAMADYHNTFAHAINHNVLHKLNHVKNDIKLFITDLENEPRQLASEVGTHRVESTRLLSQLAQGIAHSKSNPHSLAAKDDPVLIHRQVEAQLKAQLNFENSLTRMIIEYQKKAAELEKRVNVDIQTAVKEFETARITAQEATNKHWQSIHAGITQLDPELEWNEYAERSGHLISESVTMREVSKIAFPGQNDDTTKAIKAGFLERKKRYTKHYKEGYYVLTPSGYLHEHKSSDPIKDGEPEMSIFMPNCTIGAPAARGSKTFKWHVEGHKNSSGGVQVGSLKKIKSTLHIGRKDVAFSFKARTFSEMTQWWELLQHPAKGSFTQATVRSSLPPGEAVTAVSEVGFDRASTIRSDGRATVTRRAAESSDGESGGSSEEEDTVLSPEALSTAPTTPSHLHHERAPSEGLPVYKGGDHTEAPLSTLKEKPEFHPVHDVPQQTVSTS
ncbi:hypothetical protein MJO28_010736 [Puccinia striiformis f. sp. tritici]|uniref:Uncharacterized protein n=1 Tax=Puccinia striiformis f. sp. tritici TaxID=168172 RepID=A0ACC0E5V6_9BASI|nr:hypothetical protein Pst134EA_019555 [Puccinia striiformis f. sp. tritici]KAH9459402.1 hypothetical protein Pst134EA_019555 [Puccinia striiformis f. sp. tritici]KAI7945041.1 hypothetical protein MJO28_010736 [Puccinia striiformis f. sp. tritici]KAI7948815.1 hypothetical protein MJO29_010480 [Puccinia striiformis f. sp. tritici]KAI9610566.1 hypothetical protein H4Q26_006709 [Puccinia striiformis f. sp. tritici PST-130]